MNVQFCAHPNDTQQTASPLFKVYMITLNESLKLDISITTLLWRGRGACVKATVGDIAHPGSPCCLFKPLRILKEAIKVTFWSTSIIIAPKRSNTLRSMLCNSWLNILIVLCTVKIVKCISHPQATGTYPGRSWVHISPVITVERGGEGNGKIPERLGHDDPPFSQKYYLLGKSVNQACLLKNR